MHKTAARPETGHAVRTTMIAVLVVLGLTGLAACSRTSAANANRVFHDFQKGQQELLDVVSEVELRSRAYSEENLLASLGKSALNGYYHQFDRATPSAVSGGVTQGDPSDDALASLEFFSESSAPPGLQPTIGPFSINDNTLVIEQWKIRDYLQTTHDLDIPVTTIGEFELRLKVDKGTRLELRVSTVSGVNWNGLRRISPRNRRGRASIPVLPDGEFHTYRIQAEGVFVKPSARQAEKLSLKSLLLRPSNVEGDTIELSHVRILSKRAKYSRAPYGATSTGIGGEFRRVLYANTPLTLDFPVVLPAGGVELEFGMGILMDDDPVKFEVEISCPNTQTTQVFSDVVDEALTWSNVRLDVDQCAGGPAVFQFRSTAVGGNVAFWSNPELYSAPQKKLNVILVLEDTLRADHMSCFGYPRATTPYKDTLFRNGVIFERAFSQATKTRPSVPSIMTSLYPTATGVWHLSDRLDDSYVTLAEIMRSQGFASKEATTDTPPRSQSSTDGATRFRSPRPSGGFSATSGQLPVSASRTTACSKVKANRQPGRRSPPTCARRSW